MESSCPDSGSLDWKSTDTPDRRPDIPVGRPLNDYEGLIPVVLDQATIFYVLDCPSLHLIEGSELFMDGVLPGRAVSVHSGQ